MLENKTDLTLGRVGEGPRVIAFDAHIDTVDVSDPDLPLVADSVPLDGAHFAVAADGHRAAIASTTRVESSPSTTISILTFGTKSTRYSAPR